MILLADDFSFKELASEDFFLYQMPLHEDISMPELRFYRLFISHAWIHNDDYYTLVDMLNNANNFRWHNYSVPEHNPLLVKTNKQLDEGLVQQIRPTQTVIIISGMYVAYRQWIQREIEMAQEMNKPIIGIKPWGNERIPMTVQIAACEMVNWNTNSIVDAIRRNSL
jgi:MTH538 TIR-like domain (DUF1863)